MVSPTIRIAFVALTFAVAVIASIDACGGDSATTDGGGDATTADVLTTDGFSADAPADGATEAGACNTSKPFGAPVAITELNTLADEGAARLTHDELTVYFDRTASFDAGVADGFGGADLVTATRPSKSATWGTVSFLSAIESKGDDSDPTPTADNLTLYFTSTRTGSLKAADIWVATRASTSLAFGSATDVAELNTTPGQGTSYVMPDGLTLYFGAATTNNHYDLFRATRTSSTPFAVDTSGLFATVNTPTSFDDYPVVTLDELTIYFASDRTGGQGGQDIWTATRPSKSDPFGAPTDVAEVSTSRADFPTWISDDGCRLYTVSRTGSVLGSTDLFVATKPAN